MRFFMPKILFAAQILFFLLFTRLLYADQAAHDIDHHADAQKTASPAIMHMSHFDMIHSEQDFLREMIPHHQEAVDTSVLLFISTEDPQLKMLSKAIFNAQTDEILQMRLAYARQYNLIPTGAMYQPMMSDLNKVSGRERDILYVKDMIRHHQGALKMAEKLLTFKDVHEETIIFAKEIIQSQQTEIDFMNNWLKKVQAVQ